MKRVMILFSLTVIGSGPLAAQDAPAPLPSVSEAATSNAVIATPTATVPAASLEMKQQQLNQLERQLAEIRKQIAQQETKQSSGFGVQATVPRGRRSAATTYQVSVPGLSGPSPSLLVVPGASDNPKEISSVLEDMKIMSRILEKELKEFARGKREGFLPWDAGKRNIEGLYLSGYGLVFRLEVGFPLISQGEKDTGKDEEEPGDKVWRETRQEVFEPVRSRSGEADREAYDPEKVADLKESIARTLKHATNIRSLGENECVVLTVISRRKQSKNFTRYYGEGYGLAGYGSGMTGGMGMGGGGYSGMADSRSRQKASVLNIKATKADIDSFAQGQFDLEQFQSQLQITLY